MNQQNRIVIEKGLDAAKPMSAIASELGKDPTTISKEIKKRGILQRHNAFNEKPNRRALAKDCHRKNLCETYAPICKRERGLCPQCHSHCPDFVPFDYHCALTDKAPFVRNGRKKKSGRGLDKYYYRTVTAHRQYRTVLTQSRAGINVSEDGLAPLDETVSPLIRQGQSVCAILQNHPEITRCEKTLYNHIQSGALSVDNLDLPKKVKYKPRKARASKISDTGIFEGRAYKDYQAFIRERPDTRVTEMDTVVGCEGSRKVLLTLHFRASDFMMAWLLESKESSGVEAVFNRMEKAIGACLFRDTMPVILTDRGGEFGHPDSLERGADNAVRTNIYYCDPMASWQKPHCEKNHEHIRKICPQGKTSFDRLTQADVSLMMSHINSSCRESLGGLTPFTLARMMLPEQLLLFSGIVEIPPDEVVLTPALLKGKADA